MQAILYARFSSDAQALGDSIDRQIRTCTPFIDAKGWTLEAIVRDEGRSAFKAHHRRADAGMGTLEREVMEGLHVNKVLVIERLDRFSRENHSDTYDLIRVLTKNGLSIATVDGDRLYEAYQPIEFASMIELLVRLKMNHEASETKASHGRAKWEKRRSDMIATKKPVTKLCPAWLRMAEDRSCYEIFEDRDKTIRLIFEMADSGMGSLRITKALNERKILPWSRFTNRTPRAWSRGTIIRFLQDVSVTGDHQPMKVVDSKRVPVGEPIRGYYPKIVEADMFARVSTAAADRKAVPGNKSDVPNLVAGLAYCAECGAKMTYRHNRRAGHVRVRDGVEQAPTKSASASLLCPIAIDGGCENKRSIAYVSLEKGLIEAVLHLSLDDDAFGRRGDVVKLDVTIADRQRDHDIVYAAAVELWTSAGESAIAKTLAAKREAEADAIKAEIVVLKAERLKASGKVSDAEHITRLNVIRENLTADDPEVRTPARLKVAQGFRSVIDRIDCLPSGKSSVRFTGDRRAMFITPGRGRAAPTVSNFDLIHYGRDHSHVTDSRERKYVDRMIKLKGW
jgi:DNA invertase Pin-like site-specific DNA recombinase